MSADKVDVELRKLVKRANKARNFPTNTCPASRHVQLMGELLAKGKSYPMLTDEPEHCAWSLLGTVASLYEARTELAKAEAKLAALARVLP